MPRFKKSEKSLRPSQQLVSLGIPTHIAIGPLGMSADLTPDIGPEGVNDGRHSRIVFRDRGDKRDGSVDRQPQMSGSSTSTPGHKGDNTPHGREHEQEALSSCPDEHFSNIATDFSIEEEVEVQKLGECEDKETVAGGASRVPPEHASEGDNIGEGVHDTVQLGKSRVPKKHCGDMELVATPIPTNVSKETVGGFGPLRAALRAVSTIYTDHKEAIAIGNKIEDLLPRTEALEARFAIRPGDVAEQRRRSELIREFGCIEGQLWSLAKKPEPLQFDDHVQDFEGASDIEGLLRFLTEKPEPPHLDEHVQGGEEVSGLLEDLWEIISNYQMVQQIAFNDQQRKLITSAEAAVLNNFRCAQGAEYRHGNRRGCLKGTRRAVLDEIGLWAQDFDKPHVYWLNGLAGIGKSTIAQTVAERMFADGQLGASFFCSRDFEDRSNLQFIFPTLAVQLARRYTKFRSILVPLVQSDPGIAYESLYNQMDKLIIQPLIDSAISTVIVIDALDECKDEEPASAILSVLGQFVSQIAKVKFFLTGRPEPRILEGFRLHLPAKTTSVFVLHDVKPSLINNDIQLFFKQSFLELTRRRQGLDDWPTKEQLDLLCEQAAGLFIYASATIKFINHRNNDPKEQLDHLLRLPDNSAREGKTKLKANTTLDFLYMSILQEAFGDDDPEDDPTVRSILGAVTLAANPLSPSSIATLLGFGTESVFRRLSSVHSLLLLQDINQPVQPFHKSFPDFITNQTRCTNQWFCVFPPDHHMELLIGCLELMNQKLEKNMCKLPDGVINSEVDDLRERTKQYISFPLWYACRSWHKHLITEHMVPTLKITSALHHFLEKKFIFWLEVLSVLGAAREAVDALRLTARWLKASQSIDLVNDCFQFVTGFFEVISKSAPHIYHSALPLSPQMSIVRKLYEHYAHPLARIIRGVPISWDPSIAAKKLYNPRTATWSPCSNYIAVLSSEGVVSILDAMTLEQLTVFDIPLLYIWKLLFSTDGHFLTCYGDGPKELITLDLQTGVLISDISIEFNWGTRRPFVASACGTMVGILESQNGVSIINTYNTLSGTHLYSHPVESEPSTIWADGEYLQYLTLGLGFITIWGVGFASEHPPTEVKSLPAPSDFDPSSEFIFLPTLSRLAFVFKTTVHVWDAQCSKLLLNSVHTKEPENMTFSPDLCFFAYGTGSPEIYLWMDTPTGYILHQKLISSTGIINNPRFSPNGQWIITSFSGNCQLWEVTNSTTSPSSIPAQAFQDNYQSFILRFSPDGSLAVTARLGDNTATVLDLKSGDTRLVIDTGIEIYSLGVAGGTIMVAGDEKIITWKLPARNHSPNFRADINSSVQTTVLNSSISDHPPPDYSPSDHSLSNYSVSNHSSLNHLIPIHSLPKLSLTPGPMSPSLHHVAAIVSHGNDGYYMEWLCLYNTSTGQHLTHAPIEECPLPFFTPDGCEIWCVDRGGEGAFQGWSIVEDSESGTISLEDLGSHPPKAFPWESSHGYKITDDGWILSSSGKQLLWLLPHWWLWYTMHETFGGVWYKRDIEWSGPFLAFLQSDLSEVVILELLEE